MAKCRLTWARQISSQRPAFTASAEADQYEIEVNGKAYDIGAVSMGNPHVVLLVPDVSSAAVATLGPALEAHRRFPQRSTWVSCRLFPHTDSLAGIRARVGETQACGTALVRRRDRSQTRAAGRSRHRESAWRRVEHPLARTGRAFMDDWAGGKSILRQVEI